jgi:hypothetical protein
MNVERSAVKAVQRPNYGSAELDGATWTAAPDVIESGGLWITKSSELKPETTSTSEP